MVAPDGFGLDSATGNMYVTDIFGNSIWRFAPGGSAQLWTSVATNPLLVLPDGVKVFNNAVYTSIEGGKILRIPINPDGSAGTATVWAQVPGAFFDDMVLDDRTGDVYVTRLDTNELLQITPGGVVTPIATHADGLLGAASMPGMERVRRSGRASLEGWPSAMAVRLAERRRRRLMASTR